ncbi:dynamin family protein [Magnaporthiopsis poae ATCC 64411]|uniref:Dynamin family protein n=1 Tax=Magnaporthiopsis poae (strain ATCC 64411 / 73-15) TaxID=644358 RepID=A0A0C4EGL4_MAGP6|nr:dynamin family protein [Magnaporthiopsis poae ATCC 64411]
MPGRIKSERRAQTIASGSRAGTLSPGTVRDSPKGRAARSGAPSVSTFQAPASLPAASVAEEVDDDIIMMETRPKPRPIVKSEFASSELQNESFFGGSISNDSVLRRNFGRIANNLTALGETLGELHSLGIQHVAALPSLVLVGDQSSGKSTLMSGIAGISLPQSDGMCTRCPLHIRLAKSPTWKLQISLQQDYKFEPRIRHKEFGQWIDQPRVTKDFWSTTVKDDEHIRMALGWAQVAILNHDTNYRQYIPTYRGPLDMEHEKARLEEQERSAEATFSPNTVALHISGPSCPDLSFYDLPGIIKTPKHEEQSYLVRMVENLATKYITDKNAIIMWAVAMNADPENSSTLTLIRNKGAKDRTVGVMTKADLLPQSGRNHDQWLHMLQGKQHSVGHGFFITARQRTDLSGSGHDLEHQNSFEESYFNYRDSDEASNSWPRTFEPFSKRCGLQALVVFLSETLSSAFHQSLPGILDMIENRLGDVNEELKRLPDTPQHPYTDMMQALFIFRKEVEQELRLDSDFDKAWGTRIEEFRDAILNMKPKYIVNEVGPRLPRPTPPVTPTASRTIQVVDLVKDSDETPDTPSRRRNHRAFMEGQDNGNAFGTPKRPRYTTAVKEETESRAGSVAPSQSGSAARPRSLEQVRKLIRSATKHGVPDEMPLKVKRDLSLEAIGRWDGPLNGFMAQFVGFLQQQLQKLLFRSFDNLQNRAVFRSAQDIIDRFVCAQEAALKQMLSALHHRERSRLYTLDTDTFACWRQSEYDILVHSRHHYRWAAHLAGQRNPKEQGPLLELDKMTAQNKHEEEKERQTLLQTQGPDPYEKELQVCAYVRGYYQIAARRFVDSVALAVGAELIPALVTKLAGEFHLDQSLGFRTGNMDDARLEELMTEQPEVAAKRRKLQDEQEKLCSAMASINKLKLESAENDSAVDVGSQTNAATSFASRGDQFPTVVDDESAVA